MMTDDTHVVEISFPNELGYEKIARAVVADTAHKMGFSGERIEDLKTAVAEACTNSIEYGNSFDAEAQVLVVLSSAQNSISVRVVDEGRRPIPTLLYLSVHILRISQILVHQAPLCVFILQLRG